MKQFSISIFQIKQFSISTFQMKQFSISVFQMKQFSISTFQINKQLFWYKHFVLWHSMKKQPKERPAPEDLMVSETSVWIFHWIFFGHLHRNVSLFSLHFSVCSVYFSLNSSCLCSNSIFAPKLKVGFWFWFCCYLLMWFGELIQNFHSHYRVSIKTILMLDTHFLPVCQPEPSQKWRFKTREWG